MTTSHRPRKRFGQNFLVSNDVIDGIVNAIAPHADDTLVEIGPGRGAITKPLADSGAELHAVEFDRDLVPLLREQFANYSNVHIHEADALQFDYSSFGEDIRIVGNLPYNISTPLLFHLVKYKANVRDLFFMLQKEVVQRIAAQPGSKNYGRLTIMLGCHMQSYSLFDVPAESFDPVPKVTSSVIALRPLAADTVAISDEAKLTAIVAQAFSKRRKTLRNALKGQVNDASFAVAGIDPSSRPEQISIESWIALSNLQ